MKYSTQVVFFCKKGSFIRVNEGVGQHAMTRSRSKLQFKFNICRSRFSVCPVANQSMYKTGAKRRKLTKGKLSTVSTKPGPDHSSIKIKYYKNIQKHHPSICYNINFSQNNVCIHKKIKVSFLLQ